MDNQQIHEYELEEGFSFLNFEKAELLLNTIKIQCHGIYKR
jgi:hypothetical protein